MIKDNIKNAKLYYHLSPRLEIGLKYLQKAGFSAIKNGKYELLGDEVFALVQDYFSKPLAEGKFEAHKKYIDIQFIVEGIEKLGICNIQNFLVKAPYDEKKDIEFLTPIDNNLCEFFELKEGEFTIFYPQDAHMPSLAIKEPSFVKKVVVKVLVN